MKKVLLYYDKQNSALNHCRGLYYKGVYPMACRSEEEASDLIAYNKFDLVIVDLSIPFEQILSTVKKLALNRSASEIICFIDEPDSTKAKQLSFLGVEKVFERPDHTKDFLDHVQDSLEVCFHTSSVSGEFYWG